MREAKTMQEEHDYSGYDDFVRFHEVNIKLPDDLVNEVEQLALAYPKYSRDGIYAILLYDGLANRSLT